ncbi:MAG: DoxX family protein [Deinococcota bacterium]
MSITTRILLTLIQAPLAFIFLASATTKLAQPHAKLAADVSWANAYSPRIIKLLGISELLAAYGLVLPTVMNVAPILAPAAALSMLVLMLGATRLHLRRREWRWACLTFVLMGLLAGVLYTHVRINF